MLLNMRKWLHKYFKIHWWKVTVLGADFFNSWSTEQCKICGIKRNIRYKSIFN